VSDALGLHCALSRVEGSEPRPRAARSGWSARPRMSWSRGPGIARPNSRARRVVVRVGRRATRSLDGRGRHGV